MAIQVAAVAVSTLVFVLLAYATRAGRRRILAALAGGLAAGALGVPLDVLAIHLGLWRYPGVSGPVGPIAYYVAAGVGYGGGLSLVGWRLARRFGWRGLVGLVAAVAVYGPARDWLAGRVSGILSFAPGPLPLLADALCWATLIPLALLVMRLVAGPASADRLRA